MKNFFRILLCSICMASLPVAAQWQWIDKDGRKVFSDRAPPSEIQDGNILKRPGARVTATSVASGPQGASSAPKLSGVDKELADKKKKADEAEAAQRKTEDDRILKAKVENCVRAKQAKTSFDSGMRIARTNEKGEREILDDAARAAEVKRIQLIIDSDCK